MVMSDLGEAFRLTVQVGAAITYVCYISHRADDQGSSHGRAHVGPALLVVLVHSMVGLLHSIRQQFHKPFVIHFVACRQDRQHIIDDRLNGQAAGILAIRMPSHAICYDEQPELLWLGVLSTRALHGKQAIFVWLMLALDARVCTCPYYQAQVAACNLLHLICLLRYLRVRLPIGWKLQGRHIAHRGCSLCRRLGYGRYRRIFDRAAPKRRLTSTNMIMSRISPATLNSKSASTENCMPKMFTPPVEVGLLGWPPELPDVFVAIDDRYSDGAVKAAVFAAVNSCLALLKLPV